MPIPAQLGSLVQSRCGHDGGRWFLVLGIEDGLLLLADGKTRRCEKPKRKKSFHVRVTPRVALCIASALTAGRWPENHEVRKALVSLTDSAPP